jgi:hypothetical protein
MRLLPALLGALLVTLVIFLFMHSLIQRGKEEGVPLIVYNDVQIVPPQQEEPPPPDEAPEEEAEPVDEPTMEPLAVAAAAPPAPVAADTLEIPAPRIGRRGYQYRGRGRALDRAHGRRRWW